MKLFRFFFRTLKGIYDILATYLLVFVVPFALAGFAFHLTFEATASFFGYASDADMWDAVAEWSPVSTIWLRIGLFLPLHIATWWLLRKPVARVWPYVEEAFDQLVLAFRWFTDRLPGLQAAGELAFTVVVTALLVPFVIQPTLVPELGDERAWFERTANLLDGTAVASLADSVVGMYRRIYVDPVVAEGVPASDLDVFQQADDGVASGPIVAPMPSGKQPLMDRWDPYIKDVAGDSPEQFAFIKAFMWVESGGRQYAVSHTGCAGLMQFCAPTARNKPFKKVFGTGQIYTCSCRDKRCRIPRDVQRDLESGDPAALERHKDQFPCEMTDARFNPKKIITAGGLYIDDLRGSFGDNIYLMYIGYNSGPRVAQAVYERLGRNPNATLSEIEIHLATAMEPYYGSSAQDRARSLVRTHLPKIRNAYDKYYISGGPLTEPPAP